MGKGFGITSFILSLISIICLFLSLGIISAICAIIFGILAVIFSIIQFKKEKSSLAIAGLIIGIIGIAIGTFNIVAYMLVKNSVENNLKLGEQAIENMQNNMPK